MDPCASSAPPSSSQLTRSRSENRLRLPLEIIKISRARWPSHKPLFIRISATDWHAAGEKNEKGEYISWGIEQSKILLAKAVELGVDLMDVSSGGNDSDQKISVGPGYQVRLAVVLVGAKLIGLGQVAFATALKNSLTKEANIPISRCASPFSFRPAANLPPYSVGLITSGKQAEEILQSGKSDIVRPPLLQLHSRH